MSVKIPSRPPSRVIELDSSPEPEMQRVLQAHAHTHRVQDTVPFADRGKRVANLAEVIDISDSDSDDVEPVLRPTLKLAGPSTSRGQIPTPGGSQTTQILNGASDSKVAPKAAGSRPISPAPAKSTPPPISGEDAMEVDPIHSIVSRILDIVPDIDPEHAYYLVTSNYDTHGAETAALLLHQLFENPNYPKVDRKGKGKKREADDDIERGSKRVKLDYLSEDRAHAGSHYIESSLSQLEQDFPRIPKAYLRQRLEDHNSLYVPTYLALRAMEDRMETDPTLVRPYMPLKQTSKRGKGKGKARAPDPTFEQERKWLIEQLDSGADLVRTSVPPEEVEDDGCEIECQCCFGDYPFSQMVQCPDAHLFCSSCLGQYAATKLGEHNPNITCMHADGCSLPFPSSELRRVLSDKLMSLYERVKQSKEIEDAGLEGLEDCPFCDWRMVIDVPKEEDKLFRCGNEDGGCGIVSCRLCRKPDHLPKSCKEADEDKVLDKQHLIEEAMTKALMRNCPKCKKPFIKEQGCNKMSCPNCHTLSCYVCRKVISGYDHFHQNQPGQPAASPSKSKKCPLWDSLDARHAEEVKKAAEQAIADLKETDPDMTDAIKVDIPKTPVNAPNPTAAAARAQERAIANAMGARDRIANGLNGLVGEGLWGRMPPDFNGWGEEGLGYWPGMGAVPRPPAPPPPQYAQRPFAQRVQPPRGRAAANHAPAPQPPPDAAVPARGNRRGPVPVAIPPPPQPAVEMQRMYAPLPARRAAIAAPAAHPPLQQFMHFHPPMALPLFAPIPQPHPQPQPQLQPQPPVQLGRRRRQVAVVPPAPAPAPAPVPVENAAVAGRKRRRR